MTRSRTLALDEGSRTSAQRAQVLLSEMHGLRPRNRPLSDAVSVPRKRPADALLMIVTGRMHPARALYQEIWDLATVVTQWTRIAVRVRDVGRPPRDRRQHR